MIIYAGIDGTGPEFKWWNRNDEQYKQDFSDSHVMFLNNKLSQYDPFYHRGPTLLGVETMSFAELAYQEVIKRIKKFGENTPIFLAGYSRGGASVIETALFLKQRDNLPVEGLILFDPVDRSSIGGVGGTFRDTPIVDTVKTVVYAQRNPAAKSRESFKNCGTRMQDREKTDRFHKYFYATHGGLGGCPWLPPSNAELDEFVNEKFPDNRTYVTFRQDIIGKWDVRAWMWTIVSGLISGCLAEQNKPKIPTLPPFYQPPGKAQRIHVVKPGDWLSKIAITYYGDMNKWKAIYDYPENRKTIGGNPNLIKPGQRLIIP
jgi:hypothetical protein